MKLEAEQVIIPNGASVSNAIDMRSRTLREVIVEGTWTAADITFQVGLTETGTFYNLTDWDGVLWANTVTTGSASTPRQEVGEALGWLKIRSASIADNLNAVNQGAARTITLLTSPRQV